MDVKFIYSTPNPRSVSTRASTRRSPQWTSSPITNLSPPEGIHFKDSLETSKEITPMDSDSKKAEAASAHIATESDYGEIDNFEKKIKEAFDIIKKAKNNRNNVEYTHKTSEETVISYLELVEGASKSLVELSDQLKDVADHLTKQMDFLTDEIQTAVVPGYYRRNAYPHPWRLRKNRSLN
ncbi:unnamed protein product [Blepharisma stoltei]|uniref:Uncharacterized protein n=1 Tax=Blepharisma stoltei TaxID=1481888 RepID=A0AAU9IK82_9CILI|nr:unnamed protein product [Blepharisma stoltei]